jgi:hypothetical protein
VDKVCVGIEREPVGLQHGAKLEGLRLGRLGRDGDNGVFTSKTLLGGMMLPVAHCQYTGQLFFSR